VLMSTSALLAAFDDVVLAAVCATLKVGADNSTAAANANVKSRRERVMFHLHLPM
jgi:hypothetical protein